MARNAEPKCDTEIADENVYLVAETSTSDMLLDLSAADPRQLTRSDPAARRTDDIVSVALEPDRSNGLLGGFP